MPATPIGAEVADDRTPVLSITGVDFVRAGREILAGIDLTVYAGQHWALLGANGAGKSTLLNVIAGVMTLKAGTVRIEHAASLGYLPQVTTIDRDYPVSVLEFAALGR
jgi:ABC-type Mn2+/Zn2+ transport system ATPase subunit